MAHLNYFGVENFRVFKTPARLKLRDITFLIGANNSGKSSLSKALALFKDSLINPKTALRIKENIMDLGAFDKMVNYDSSEKYFSFIIPFTLKNIPSIGDSITIDFKQKYLDGSYSSYSFEYNGKVILSSDFKKIYFNFDYFFSLFKANPQHIIKDLGEIERSAFSKIQGKGQFGIISPNQSSRRDFQESQKGVTYMWHDEVEFNEVFLSNDKDELEDILNLYDNPPSSYGIQDIALTANVLNSLPDGSNYSDEVPLDNPLFSLLLKNGLNHNLCSFISKYIFENFSDISGSKLRNSSMEIIEKVVGKIIYQPSFHGKFQQNYNFNENSQVNEIIKNYIEKVDKEMSTFVKEWIGRAGFDLGEKLEIKTHKNLELRTIEIDDSPVIHLGRGAQQLICLLLSLVISKNKIYIVEEPEAFLHPAFQSKLADFFIDANKVFGHQFIIETHSEYLIRKMQYNVGMGIIESDLANIYNFSKNEESPVKEINFLKDGRLSSPFAPGFYDESENIIFALLAKESLN